MRYKALIFDLDGTVVPSRQNGMPTKKVVEAVKKAEKYVKVSVATGRPIYLAQNIINAFEIKGPVVVNGGAQIIDTKTKKILFNKKLSAESQRKILNICYPYNYKILDDNEGRLTVDNADDIQGERGKFCIEAVSPDDAKKIIKQINSIGDAAAHPTTSWVPGNVVDIHITHALATKKHAIEELLKMLNVTKEEVIGIGDSFNDLPLLNSVGLKIVVGNAPEELKKIADYVAPTLEEDGVAIAIEKFILS